jgi:hypothetical protein
MRSKHVRVCGALLAGVAMAAVLRAQEQPPAEPSASAPVALPADQAVPQNGDDPASATPEAETKGPPADAASDPSDPSAASQTPAADDKDAAGPPGKAPTGKSPARFEPTEKVRADFDVSFPVDI